MDETGKHVKAAAGEFLQREEIRTVIALEAATRHNTLVILGDPGSGKSSLVNHLMAALAAKHLNPASELSKDWPHGALLPVRILLRELAVTLEKKNQEKKWWSEEGREYRQRENWEQPRHWDNDALNLPNQPVVGVSWFEAEAFCNWLTEQVKEPMSQGARNLQIVRLPTEAEWEFAARGSEGRKYQWGNPEPTIEHANYEDSKIGRPTAVGSFSQGATPEGILDLAGNVWEWCLDWYGDKYYAECTERGVVKNPHGPKTGGSRVLRGGAFWSNASDLRGARRSRVSPVRRSNYRGFHVVVSAES